ncbi:MAG: nucleoside monophosphate kinase [Holosporaceae bacterium]|jgi:adenylate kinase|nr:nucleoside monophosphate kinase [Holosporaceae bacterium]
MTANLIILFGAPGSGKGTVAQYLKDKYDLHYFSTGNLLRNEVKEKTDVGLKVESILGVGGLAGDDIVNEIVAKNIDRVRGDEKIVLLDGYPRTKNQAVVLDGIWDTDSIRVMELDVNPEEVIFRISRRRICARCGSTYGPTDKIDVCPCGGELIKRKDDEEATVRNRLKEYERATLPLLLYYSDRSVKICGEGAPEEVVKRVDDCLCNWGIGKRR